ncbi:MAG: hypothetical protein AB9869_11490 [Verrucomicrobiia bacterium]
MGTDLNNRGLDDMGRPERGKLVTLIITEQALERLRVAVLPIAGGSPEQGTSRQKRSSCGVSFTSLLLSLAPRREPGARG